MRISDWSSDVCSSDLRYADAQGWRVELISASPSDAGGYKEVVASVTGSGVFAKLKFESGVHRVQRVPVTESGGRSEEHTSELQSLMRISYAVFCLKKKNKTMKNI